MAQDRIDPSAIQWNSAGSSGAAQRDVKKDEASVESSKAGAQSSRISAAKGAAELPYVSTKAKAEAEKAVAEAEKAKRDAEAAKRGRFLEGDDKKELEALIGALDITRPVTAGFKPDYAGTFFDFPTQLENYLQSRAPSWMPIGTRGQADWWKQAKKFDVIERNKYFGASLAPNEKQSWEETTISPGMSPETIKKNLAAREKILTNAINRKTDFLRVSGYRPEQIDAILGGYKDEFVPGKVRREAPPTSDRVAGESVQGARLPPEAEDELIAYVRSPQYTPEGYGQLLAQKALEGGLITPEQVPDYTARAAEAIRPLYEGMSPEQRATTTPGYIDYSQVDEQAMQNAGLGEVMMQALRNVPESAVQFAEGVLAPGTDLVRSAVTGERQGLYKVLPDIAGELVTPGENPTTDAMLASLKERYTNPKRTIATDPVGSLADLSLGLGGASKVSRIAGRTGPADQLAAAARAVDPIRLGTSLPDDLRRLGAKYPRVGAAGSAVIAAPGALTRHTLGLSTGVPGGEGYRRALQAGFEHGAAGAPTPRSENFIQTLRGLTDDADVVRQAEDAVKLLQKDASDAYRSGYVDVQNDATVLDFGDIDKALTDLSGRAFYKGQVRDPAAAKVFTEVRDLVEEWKGLDPAQFHTPEGMDTLKQRIGGIGEKLNADNDRRAASIAKGLYGEVKNTISRQVPSYATTMKGYEEAQGLLSQIKGSLSLKDRAGVDTKLRKLQSVLRNNASTDYGYRTQLAELLDARSGKPILDTLAAQSVRAWEPRSLARVPASGMAASGIGGLLTQNIADFPISYLDPSMLAALPLMSPRLMAETSYGLGRAAGTAKRGMSAAYNSRAGQKVRDLYDKYPEAFLAAGQTGALSDETEDRLDKLRQIALPVLSGK